MTRFEVTPELKSLITKSTLNAEIIDKLVSSDHISHQNLVTFYKTCKPTDSLLQLIKTTKVYIPSTVPEKKPQSKEFIKNMEMLRLKAKEDEYQKLINPTPEMQTLYEQTSDSKQSPAQMHKELKNQLTTILNVFISVASVMYAVWYWTNSSMRIQTSYRVLLSLFFGILVLVAEVVVYMGYINKVEEARKKERQTKEVKTFLKQLD
ncbi:vacuolar ATPase assembly integral membrane protein Vph2p [[Candida] anglica]|uniref:Vacuolar ATPase assembly integral membrane protein Vph2p n=1 Tax=[Candida] anglica TaxID=148631 RepID=A0ABP0EQ97_9ASCO